MGWYNQYSVLTGIETKLKTGCAKILRGLYLQLQGYTLIPPLALRAGEGKIDVWGKRRRINEEEGRKVEIKEGKKEQRGEKEK